MEEGSKATEWERCSVAPLLEAMPAVSEIVRCALPAELARHVPTVTTSSDGSEDTSCLRFAGMPTAIWKRAGREPTHHLFCFRWQRDKLTHLGLISVSRHGAVRFVIDTEIELPAAAQADTSAALLWQQMLEEESPFLDDRRRQAEHAEAREASSKPLHLADALEAWHEKLFLECTEAGYAFSRIDEPINVAAWRRSWKVVERNSEEFTQVHELVKREVLNFDLLCGNQEVAESSRPRLRRCDLPFYGNSTCLYELSDRRSLRSRTSHLLVCWELGLAAALSHRTGPLHAFNERLAQSKEGQLRSSFCSRINAAQYLDFHCRFVYGHKALGGRPSFGLIQDAARDLRWIEANADGPADKSAASFMQMLTSTSVSLGAWPLEPLSEPIENKPADAAASESQAALSHFFSALVLYGRELSLCAFRVRLSNNSVQVEMVEDIGVSPSALPVIAQTFDPDANFVLNLASGNGLIEFQPFALRSDDAPGSEPQTPAAVDGEFFIAQLLQRGDRLPRGPADPDLAVNDMVEMRGRQDIKTSLCAYGVRFRGRVDLREVRITGSLDLSFCIFEDVLLLQDAEIEGSLDLSGATFLRGVNLRGTIVRGNLRLTSCVIGRSDVDRQAPALELSGAHVEGDLNIEAVAELGLEPQLHVHRSSDRAPGIRARGIRVQGRLLVGCDRYLGSKAPFDVGDVDAIGALIGSDVIVRGRTSQRSNGTKIDALTAPRFDLSGSQIRGGFLCSPFETTSSDEEEGSATKDDQAQRLPHFSSIDLHGSSISGDIRVGGAQIVEFDLRQATVRGSVVFDCAVMRVQAHAAKPNSDADPHQAPVHLWPSTLYRTLNARGVRVRGNFFATGISVGGDLLLQEAQIDGMVAITCRQLDVQGIHTRRSVVCGDVDMSAAVFRSHVALDGVMIGGRLRMISADVGALRLLPAFGGLGGGNILPSQLGALDVRGSIVRGDLRMPFVQVLGIVNERLASPLQGVLLLNTRVQGSLVTWHLGAIRDLCDNARLELTAEERKVVAWEYAAAIAGNFAVQKSDVSGDCLLSLTKIGGFFDFADTRIGGDVMLGSLAKHHESLELNDDCRQAMSAFWRQEPARLMHWRYRAHCSDLFARMLRAENDLYLDGLAVRGSVDLKHAQVKGDALLWARDPSFNAVPYAADTRMAVGGTLDASYAVFNHLEISIYADRRTAPTAAAIDLRLSGGRIETFSARGGLPEGTRPATFELADVNVRVWDIDGDNDQPDVDTIAMILGDSSPASTWQAVESSLRAVGADGAANRIFRKGKRMTREAPLIAERDVLPPSQDNWERDLKAYAWRMVAGVALIWFVVLAGDGFGSRDRIVLCLVVAAFVLLVLAVLTPFSRRASAWRTQSRYRWMWIETAFESLYGNLLGYGTRILPVVMLWLTFVIASLPVYLNSENFEFSNAALAGKYRNVTDDDTVARLKEARQGWDFGHVAGMIVRNHIPVVSFGAVEDWDGNDDSGVTLCLPERTHLLALHCSGTRWKVLWFSPEGFGALMQMVNWVLWPVFLTFLTLHLWRRRAG